MGGGGELDEKKIIAGGGGGGLHEKKSLGGGDLKLWAFHPPTPHVFLNGIALIVLPCFFKTAAF